MLRRIHYRLVRMLLRYAHVIVAIGAIPLMIVSLSSVRLTSEYVERSVDANYSARSLEKVATLIRSAEAKCLLSANTQNPDMLFDAADLMEAVEGFASTGRVFPDAVKESMLQRIQHVSTVLAELAERYGSNAQIPSAELKALDKEVSALTSDLSDIEVDSWANSMASNSALVGRLRGTQTTIFCFCVLLVAAVAMMAVGGARMERASKALRASEEQFSSAFENAAIGIALMSLEGQWLKVNGALCELIGYTEEELLDKTFMEVTHPDDVQSSLENCNRLLTKEIRAYHMEKRYLHKDGREIWTLLGVSLVHDSKGQPMRFIAQIQDITPLKEADASLRKANDELESRVLERTQALEISNNQLRRAKEEAEGANAAKSQFLANMSHELRTPLNAVLGFADLLGSKAFGELNEKQSVSIRHILTSGRHLLTLINSVLDLAKIESGTAELQIEQVSIFDTIQEVIHVSESIAAPKKIELEVNCEPNISSVKGEASKLRQVLFNLVSNAIKFSGPNSKVQVTASMEDGAFVLVRVKDQGMGIMPEDQERIFREFEQIDGSYTRKEQGTGLGLALCLNLVEMHGGRIWVESDGHGFGSAFSFTVPVWEAEAEPVTMVQRTTVAVSRPESKITVLVVEDNPLNMDLATEILRAFDMNVLQATTAEAGIQVAQEERPDVILMDIALPGMDGLQATRILTADPQTCHIPVVALTAQAMVGDREAALEAGCADYITKPFLADDLVQTIKGVRKVRRAAA